MSPISNQPSASEINVELGRASNAAFSMNGAAERALAQVPTGTISMNDFIGKSAGGAAYTGTLTVGTGVIGGITILGFENLAPNFWGALEPTLMLGRTCIRLGNLSPSPLRFDLGLNGTGIVDNDDTWSVLHISGITDPSFFAEVRRANRTAFSTAGNSYWVFNSLQIPFVVGHQYKVDIYNTANPQ